MKVYIAGRVTGLPLEDVKRKFEKAEALARANNWNPVNPIRHVTCKAPPRQAMKTCIPLLLDCDAILLLTDFVFSEGAQIEAQIARYVGIEIINEDDL
jgi:hypothetical protein